uniref:hypothetical protein n=1 Tax=Neptunomonas sp. TaxID=1971898 RepID=UPI0025F08304
MKKSEWAEYLDGFYIVDCAIKSKQIAYVLAVQDEPPEEDEDGHIDDEEWRLISWGPEVLGGDQSVICERHYNFRPVPALAVEGEPYNRLMLTDTNGNASLGDYGKDDVPAMEKMKTLWEKLYIMNGGYVYWRNSENNTWERIDLPESLQEDNRASSGPRKYLLIDFDAFTPQDFYLLDNEGIVLYQEAGIWNETNLRDLGYRELDTYGICCGPDGWVYIFGKDEKGGKIFQGKGDRWKVIWEDNFEIFHIDMVAYQDYVLISNNIMFSKIQNGKVEHFKSPCTGSFLSVRDN